MAAAIIPAMIAPSLVGRADQLANLHLLVEGAKLGEGQIALISGEAGIGKSRLLGEVKTYTVAQGFRVLQGNCFPTDLTYPYAPLLDLLRSFYDFRPPAELAAAVKDLARDIFPLLPELVPAPTQTQPSLEPEQEKRRLFAVLAAFFARLAADSPLLLIIEDVHWSDDTSLDFLHHLARRSRSLPLLLLVTYRQDENSPSLARLAGAARP